MSYHSSCLLEGRGKLGSIILFVFGVFIAIAGAIANPAFVARNLSADHTIGAVTVAKVLFLEVVTVVLGLAVSLYSALRIANSAFVQKLEEIASLRNLALAVLFTGLLLLSMPFLTYNVLRMRYELPINRNEGWNTIHTSRLIQGGPLYLPVTNLPITPVNYPPLSFMFVGSLARVTGNVLLTGRIVALASQLVLTYLVYATIRNLTFHKPSAVLAALMWLALIAQQAGHYVGMYDPQLLGHVFSFGALYLYSKWHDNLTFRRGAVLALLFTFALFVKHFLVAGLAAFALTLLVSNRRAFRGFVSVGFLFSLLMFSGVWAYAGGDFLANFVELDRPWSMAQMLNVVSRLFFREGLSVLFLPFLMLLLRRHERWLFVLLYFVLSFLVGALATRGAGVAINAWFDFFLASALVVGLLAARLRQLRTPWQSVACGVLLMIFLPLSARFDINLDRLLSHDRLKHDEMLFRRDVELLRSISGPALFEEPLLGFLAGKLYLFDTTAGNFVIASGRIPKDVLVDPIRGRYFSAIVLGRDVHQARGGEGRWLEVLNAIEQNYRSLDLTPPSKYFFYLPERHGVQRPPITGL